MEELTEQKCEACRVGAPSVTQGEITELRPQVPVIVISGLAEAEAQYAGLDVTFLRKPCPPESLIQAVRRLETL